MRLISTQRVLQRRMRTPEDQTVYKRFIVEGERLDAFMREAAQQEELFGSGDEDRLASRDDSAARNILQIKQLPSSAILASARPETTTSAVFSLGPAAMFVPSPSDAGVEEIFQDEIDDGLAAGAREQAAVWANAARESQDAPAAAATSSSASSTTTIPQQTFDREFLRELISLGDTTEATRKAVAAAAPSAPASSAFASEQRAAPGAKQAAKYEAVHRAREIAEVEAANKRKAVSKLEQAADDLKLEDVIKGQHAILPLPLPPPPPPK
jgi:hypothetical protein